MIEGAVPLAEMRRGGFVETVHLGHAVIADGKGEIVAAWGDPDLVLLPRSSCKMVQALPLLESGAAEAFGLSDRRLALACSSHEGAMIHSGAVRQWLADLGLGQDALRCGPQEPGDRPARDAIIRSGQPPCQIHNNCSGKHTGFLTLARHLKAGPEYIEPDHPVQQAIRAAFEEATGVESPGFGIDGCSAPNFATTLAGLARAMGQFAAATDSSARGRAMHRLTRAMIAHPEMVQGEGSFATEMMRLAEGRAAIKSGAEGCYVAILPERGWGIAIKAADGLSRGVVIGLTALLVELGIVDGQDPRVQAFGHPPAINRRGLAAGSAAPAPGFPGSL